MNRARGFTLMEVMIALTLLSMMMIAIVSSLRTFANTRTTLERMTGRVDEIRMVSAFLRRSLAAAVPITGSSGGVPTFDSIDNRGNQETYISGTSSKLTWVAPVAAGAGLGGVYVMNLSWQEDALALRWKPYQKNVTALAWEGTKAHILVENVQEFAVAYRSEFGGEWISDWPASDASPVSVRMSIKAGGKYWPELVMRLE